jgi:hypothetical protein
MNSSESLAGPSKELSGKADAWEKPGSSFCGRPWYVAARCGDSFGGMEEDEEKRAEKSTGVKTRHYFRNCLRREERKP